MGTGFSSKSPGRRLSFLRDVSGGAAGGARGQGQGQEGLPIALAPRRTVEVAAEEAVAVMVEVATGVAAAVVGLAAADAAGAGVVEEAEVMEAEGAAFVGVPRLLTPLKSSASARPSRSILTSRRPSPR